jgi:recombination protein RecT
MTATAVVTTIPPTPESQRQPKGAMVKLLEPRVESLAHLLPKGLKVERVIAAAQLAAYQEPKLLQCDPASIFVAVAKVASWGLAIGTTAHLVPFGTTCTAVKDYKGVIQMIVRAGAAKTVRPGIVREGDAFEMEEGSTPFLRHRAVPGSKAPIAGFYAIAHHGRDIPPTFQYMSADEVEAVRKEFSKQHKSGALKPWYGVKTVIHRLGKYLVQDPEMAAMLDDDDLIPEGEVTFDAPLSDTEFGPGDGRPRVPDAIRGGDYPEEGR